VSAAAPFDLAGALPDHLTLIEASAGTGKTYALAALATRYVAEGGVTASELCVVSFTEAATAELRGRVRSRLAEAAAHLADEAPESSDPILAHLAAGPADHLASRRTGLEAAVADFDTATIATIHGFCSRLVAATGADTTTTVADDRTTIEELINDHFVARHADGSEPLTTTDKLARAVELRLRLPDAILHTVTVGDLTKKPNANQLTCAEGTQELAALIDTLATETRVRRARARRRTFDDLLTDARAVLTGADGAAVVAALRRRFRVVLIDEFQDTDTVQWDIFRTAFLDGPDPVTVVLVGDPKQAIYRFRSAELSAFLRARTFTLRSGGSVWSLDTNYRSDARLLGALEHVFGGYDFGDDAVRFHPVRAEAPDRPDGLIGAGPPLELRCVPDDFSTVPAARSFVVPDLVTEVVRLLESVQIRDNETPRALRPSDIAVLVRSNVDAAVYADALAAAGVPAASSSSDSVAESAAARQWRTLLRALERPAAIGPARAAMLGWFIEGDATTVAALDDESTAGLLDELRGWSTTLTDGGLAALLAAVRRQGLRQRVLAHRGGARDLTDLDHVAELLQVSTGSRPTSASALLAALDALSDPETADDTEAIAPELLARRIDGDDETVKVLTVHRAKGLEFGVVLCPTLWTAGGSGRAPWHGDIDGTRMIDTAALLTKPSRAGPFMTVKTADSSEQAAESRRLLYVALTRAKHRLVVWWSPSAQKGANPTPLGHLLTHACGSGATDVDPVALARGSADTIAMSPVAPNDRRGVVSRLGPQTEPLSAAEATRTIDRRWRIWSFTAMKAASQPRFESPTLDVTEAPDRTPEEPPAVGGTDELDPEDETAATGGGVEIEPGAPLPLTGAPGGTAFGTLVHTVLERVDFATPDLRDELRSACAEALRHRRVAVVANDLADALLPALDAPLGGPLGATRLVDLHRADRLDELAFDLPLASFDSRSIATVLARHLPIDDVLRPWAEAAAAGREPVDVAGMLTGSIDLVARTDGRYWLADYKTNVLPAGKAPADLLSVMTHHDYPLQATLYLVALHRYLRWRLPRYDPDRDLVGAAYLFLRGMDPSQPPADSRGVLWWRPPTSALDALDHLLASGAPS